MKRRILLLSTLIFVFVVWYLGYLFYTQGLTDGDWQNYKTSKVEFDADRIPLIESDSWIKIIESQGFVTASERMFQMELSRRYASGRLAEIFGSKALKTDLKQQRQNWVGVAEDSYNNLSGLEKRICDAYANGVNNFLTAHPNRIGIEFEILRHSPEQWQCRDSILVLMVMAQRLSSSAESDLAAYQWFKKLPEDWSKFIFPIQHPWNKPLFGEDFLNDEWPDALTQRPLETSEPKQVWVRDTKFYGSNSWVFVEDDARFLANDPHLGHSVPQLWYPARLLKDKNDWSVGATIPGIPGIVIGMNPNISWGLTNIGEDVESYVVEEVDFDTLKYVSQVNRKEKIWKDLKVLDLDIKIKNESSVQEKVYFTERGPLEENPYKKGEFLSRQWLPLMPGVLKLPTVFINRASDWKSFNQAVDSFTAPGQNVVYLDKDGNVGYRAAGRGIERKEPSKFLEGFATGAFLRVADATERRRAFYPFKPGNRQFLSVANQRIWIDQNMHKWAPDDRASRIAEVLEAVQDPSLEKMSRLQFDTHTQFLSIFRNFILQSAQDAATENGYFESWKKWNGNAAEQKLIFTQMDFMMRELENTLLGRIKEEFALNVADMPKYSHYLKRAWIVRLLENPAKFELFGFTQQEIASHLILRLKNREKEKALVLYDEANRWKKQHPFVGSLPILGEIFRISEPKQVGFDLLVRVEDPGFGASTRVVFDMKNPLNSIWSFPVGQSGHVHSPFYSNFRERFINEQFTPIFPQELRGRFF